MKLKLIYLADLELSFQDVKSAGRLCSWLGGASPHRLDEELGRLGGPFAPPFQLGVSGVTNGRGSRRNIGLAAAPSRPLTSTPRSVTLRAVRFTLSQPFGMKDGS